MKYKKQEMSDIRCVVKAIIVLQAALLFLSGCASVKSNNKSAGSTDRKLIWSDEFNGKKIDEKKWNVNHGHRKTDPEGRDAWWHKDNVYLEKGSLVAKTSQLADGSYAGACIDTEGKFERAFGYFETRAKIQKEEGHWGGFWLFAKSVHNVDGSGKDGTEIDVFETAYVALGKNKMESALHYDGYKKGEHQVASYEEEHMNFKDGKWHTFAVEWAPEVYKFYYDNRLVWETNFGGVCQVPLHLLVSDEIGNGNPWWAGDIRKAKLPDYMLVDYVRVYDKK